MKTVAGTLLTLLVRGPIPSDSRFPRETRSPSPATLPAPQSRRPAGRCTCALPLLTHDHHRSARKPVNLCVVLDRSGSMSEESKIDLRQVSAVHPRRPAPSGRHLLAGDL